MNENPLESAPSTQAMGTPISEPEKAYDNPVDNADRPTNIQDGNFATSGYDPKQGRGSGRRWPRIDGYELQGILGEGGMGIVYRARNISLNRPVAIKMILSGSNANTQALDRFANEIKAISKLQHRSIIQILDAGTCQDQPFFVMEFVEGQALAKRIDERTFGFREAAELCEQLALAMEYAHRQGVIHRDLKPSNILLTPDGVPKIMDFGIAKRSDFTRDLTATGVILGTPGYLAPEQAEGRSSLIGPGSDVFALGVMLYEMLAGHRPFDGLSEVEVMKKIIHDDPFSPAWYRPSIPGDLETICLKCLNKAPAKRYLTAGELAADLRRYLEGQVIHARPATVFERSNKWIRRNPVKFAGIATAVMLVIAAVGGLLWHKGKLSRSLAKSQRLAAYGSDFSMWVIRHHMPALEDVNGSTDVKLRLSGIVQRFLDNTSQHSTKDARFQHRMGVAYQNLAELQGNPYAHNLGQANESNANYRRALALFENAEREKPDDLESLFDSASCSIEFANLLSESFTLDEARQQVAKADAKIANIHRVNQAQGGTFDPNRLIELAIHSNIAKCYIARKTSDVESGVRLLDELDKQIQGLSDAPAFAETREFYLTWLAGARGYLCRLQGDVEKAKKHLLEQLRLTQVKFDRDPESLNSKNHLAVANTYIGEILVENEDFDEALVFLEKSAALYREILQVDSQNVLAMDNLCADLQVLARSLIELDEFEPANRAIQESITLRRQIVDADPDAINHQQNLASAIQMSIFIDMKLGNTDVAYRNMNELIELTRTIKTADPSRIDYQELFVKTSTSVATNFVEQAIQLNSTNQASEKNQAIAQAERLAREALVTLDEIESRGETIESLAATREKLTELLATIGKSKSTDN
jgi:serine/threonine protein kinase